MKSAIRFLNDFFVQNGYFRDNSGGKKDRNPSKQTKRRRKERKMEKVKKQAKIWLCIGIALMLLASIVVSVVQTSGGKVTMKELNIETDDGYSMSAYLFIPKNATAETPAPAVVTSHGYLNNKEMTDANYVELARRGFVVLAIDQPNHGDSEVYSGFSALSPTGVYQGVLAVSRMPFVDVNRIGITGHSMGGWSCNAAVMKDNENETRLISAVLIHCNDPTYTDADGNFVNVYGSRDVGAIAAQYDEFFHVSTDESGNSLAAPYFMESTNAQSFLHFGNDPTGLEKREAYTYYTETIDGEESFHVIYRPNVIHPWSHFSAKSETCVIDFFTKALGAPSPIDSSNQVWQWKEAFNFVGLVGLVIFICAFGILLLFTPTFESLRAKEIVQPMKLSDGKGKAWFWLTLTAGALFAMPIYVPILEKSFSFQVGQFESVGLGVWSTCCGLFTILCMVLYYFCYGKKNGFDLVERGVKMPLRQFGKSLLLALIVVVTAYACVFAADYFFKADFRIWTLAIKAFEAPILKYLPYGLLFIAYYVGTSVSVNCFNYNNIGGKRSWVNTLIIAFFAALPAIVLLLIQYCTYFGTNALVWEGTRRGIPVLWLFPLLLVLPVTAVVDRLYYKVSKNPYIAGFINAAIVTLFTITNTCSKFL